MELVTQKSSVLTRVNVWVKVITQSLSIHLVIIVVILSLELILIEDFLYVLVVHHLHVLVVLIRVNVELVDSLVVGSNEVGLALLF